MTLACALAQYGVTALLLDDDNMVGVKGASSRGICYAQKTREIFKRLGIYRRIANKDVQWSVGRTFAGADEVYAFDLRQQPTHSLSAEPPFINIQQIYMEGYLVERLTGGDAGERPVELRWKHRITDLAQNDSYATLTIETPAGSYSIEAEHVIDCSGSHIPFRNGCQASVTPKKGDDRWCIADVRFKNSPPVERHTWIEAPFNEGRAVWQHLMADGVWRIDYQMLPAAQPEEVNREEVVRARLDAWFGRSLSPEECEIVWVGPYAYRSECLDQLRHGRASSSAIRRLSSAPSAHAMAIRACRTPTTWPGSWPPWCRGAPRRNGSPATTRSATKPPNKTCLSPTALPAFCARLMAPSAFFEQQPLASRVNTPSPGNSSTPAACPHPTPMGTPPCAGPRADDLPRTSLFSGLMAALASGTTCCTGQVDDCCYGCLVILARQPSDACGNFLWRKTSAVCR